MDALNNIREIGVLPVIKIEKPEYAVPLADALRKGGINAIEVTCRNESALTSINKIKEAFPDMTVGAGTVLSAKQAEQAKAAGVDFIVEMGDWNICSEDEINDEVSAFIEYKTCEAVELYCCEVKEARQ